MATTTKTKSAGMHNPAHPGEVLKDLYLQPLGITQVDAADALGVSRKHLSAILNARAPITPDMAVRLAIGLETDAEFWLNLQAQHDLWIERKKSRPNVRPLRAEGANRLADIQMGK